MHTHWVNIFYGANDDTVVIFIADNLHFVFLPSQHRLFNQNFVDWGCVQCFADNSFKFDFVIGNTTACSAHCKRWAHNCRELNIVKRIEGVLKRVASHRAGTFQTQFIHTITKFLAVFGTINHIGFCSDHLYTQFLKYASFPECKGGVESRLPPHGREEGVWAFFFQYFCNCFRRDGFNIGCIRHVRIGHDGGRIGIHKNDPVSFLAEGFAGLCTGIIKFTGLPNNDGACTNYTNGFKVGSFRHGMSVS